MTLQPYDRALMALEAGDFAAARALFAQAGESAGALLELGRLASNGQGEAADPVRARELYERAAALGSAEAAHNLAVLHATGRGGDQDLPAALGWYRRAAELGDPGARRMTGLMYATGQGTDRDDAEAERWWREAAAAGEPRAPHDLGTLFAYHRDDPAEAAHWFLEAVKHGIEAAARELELLVPRLRETPGTRARTMLGVIQAFQLGRPHDGRPLLEASAAEGDPVAQRSLAFLVQGTDRQRALELYRAAAEGGDGFAAFNLGAAAGKSPQAEQWLRIAAEAGIPQAFGLLGDRLSDRDADEEALTWYLRGAEAGQPGPMFAAACWYRDGFGTPVDLVESLRWFLKLLDLGNGDGIHQAHGIVPRMTDDQIHEAGRLSGRRTEADTFVRQRRQG